MNGVQLMNDQRIESDARITQQLAEMASTQQQQRTGIAPTSVSAILSEDTLVVTLHDVLTPAEKALASTAAGAAQVHEFHRQLFATSSEPMRQEIKEITGREVREGAVEIEAAPGAVVHAFTAGAMVQVFLLTPKAGPGTGTDRDSNERADDDGFQVAPDSGCSG